jgi:hypothetical protein
MSVALGAATAIFVAMFVPVLGQMSLISIPIWRRLIAHRPPPQGSGGQG